MANLQHDIEKYLKGELTPLERNALERRALDDPFLMDALEGAEQISSVEFSDDMNQLHLALQERVKRKGKVIPLWMWPARIAAGLAVVAISTFLVMKFMRPDPNSDLALHEKSVPKTLEESPSINLDSGKTEVDQPIASSEPVVEKPNAISSGVKSSEITTARRSGPEEKPVETEQPAAAIAEVNDTDVEGQSVLVLEDSRTHEPLPQVNPSSGFIDFESKKKESAKLAQNDDAVEILKGRVSGVQVESHDADKTKNDERIISGRVTDEQGDGIPGVNVLIKGTDMGTVTNATGDYQIHVDGEQPNLVFSFIGMETLEEEILEKSVLDVSLNQDVSQLSEVVVVGYGAERTEDEEEVPTLELAVPAGGRTAYKQYLEKNLKYPEQALENKVEGRVTVQFTVDTSGKIGDFNILKGLGFGCDEEVIRLIKQGPKWSPTRRDTEPVADKVKVRMRFRLPKK